jgi:hypothetical protein
LSSSAISPAVSRSSSITRIFFAASVMHHAREFGLEDSMLPQVYMANERKNAKISRDRPSRQATRQPNHLSMAF